MIDTSAISEERVEFERIDAVIDSKVLLELYSVHDIVRAPEVQVQDRIDRARESLLLAIYLDQTSATTYSLSEAIEKTRQLVPPDTRPDEGDRWHELLFTWSYVWCVKDIVLSHWRIIAAKEGDALRSNAADRHLEDFAHQHQKPLITRDRKLAERARALGIEVYLPREFWGTRLDVRKGSQRFLRRFAAESPAFARRRDDSGKMAHVLRDMFTLYRYLLLGRSR